MIKEIHETEFEKFQQILRQYFDHVDANPDTLISRFFGLHEVVWKDVAGKENKKHLVIMNNVFKYKEFDIGLRFDLKGSSLDRTYLSEGRTLKDHASTKIKTALKCNDFRNHVGKITFENVRNQRSLSEIAKLDSEFLAKCDIMDYSLLVGQILVLSDQTTIQNVPWSILKEFAMAQDWEQTEWYGMLSEEEQELAAKLRLAQRTQGDSKPLVQPDIGEIDELHQKVSQNPSLYNGIYFTNDDKAYVIGIIDSLTEYDMKKKGEYALKKVRYGSPMTPEGFPGSSCQNPDTYS